MRGAVSKSGGNASLAGDGEGMGKPKRARRRKLDTAKVDLEPPPTILQRAGYSLRGCSKQGRLTPQRVSDPISMKQGGKRALRVVGRPNST